MTELEEVTDPFLLTRPEAVTETRIFTDPSQPKRKVTLTFRAQSDYSLPLKIQRIAARLNELYGENSVGGTLLPVDGRIVEPEPDLFFYIATLMVLDVTERPKPWSVHQWAALSVNMSSTFADIVGWAGELTEKAARGGAGDDAPFVSGADTETPSG